MKAALLLLFCFISLATQAGDIHEILRCTNSSNTDEVVFIGYIDDTASRGWCSSGSGSLYHNGEFVGNADFNNCSMRGTNVFVREGSTTYWLGALTGVIKEDQSNDDRIKLTCDLVSDQLRH